MKCTENEQQAGKLIFLKITAVKRVFYDVMLSQDVKAEVTRGSNSYSKSALHVLCYMSLLFFFKTTEEEWVGDKKKRK